MEKDTVVLSLKEYNELRDIKEGLETEGGEILKYITSMGIDTLYTKYSKTSDTLIKENNKLKDELIKERDRDVSKTRYVIDLKAMSIWEFLKWRKS